VTPQPPSHGAPPQPGTGPDPLSKGPVVRGEDGEKDLTVLVATFRRPEILRRTLEGYRELDGEGLLWKLVLVDNAGDEATEQVVGEFARDLPIELAVELRRGKNFALNKGLELAEGGLYLFSDDDALPAADWLQQMWTGARRSPEATMFTGRILPLWPDGHEPLELRTDLLRSSFMVTAWGEEEGPITPDRMWGPNLAIRSGPFRDGYRFDTSIGPAGGQYAMGSELELTLRLAEEGCSGVYLPGAVVYHQIRPEQMEERWLAWRAYRSGRGVARLQGVPTVPMAFGVPRFVFREMGTHGWDWLAGWLTRNETRRQDGKLAFYHWRGKLREYWRLRGGGDA